ncbi:Imm42 family immunity protein [Gallibacterium salpingitidis]|uniref:Imm42 family immunity protein n=1 Tax=Gallibacterium salpingitidis TaxID=505341 RepID=UPI0018D31BFA|nr:Imm42 family immunity protein [Gallibacterium salpingitidis]WKT00362.1 immunity 42 family protein [Gallibacterium salpingitidis]
MIIGNPYEIAIQLEQVDYLCSASGIFNFIIDHRLYPGEGITINLYTTISALKHSLDNQLNHLKVNCTPLSEMDFSDGEPENTIILYNGELFDYGFICWLAVTEDEDRFFIL